MSKNSIDDQGGYSEKERVKSGLMAVFPTFETYRNFIEDDKGDLEPFLRIARDNGIIGEEDGVKAFEAFIKANSRRPGECTPPAGLKLSELLEDKEKIIKSSVRSLTDWINKLIKKFALNNMMPAGKVSNVMFTRLAREPANTIVKRNTLRLLSFWFGYNRPHLDPSWNYETLFKLCPREHKLERNEGVRIGFSLHSRGDVIEDKTVRWLRKELQNCTKFLELFQCKKIKSYSITSLYLDLPKEGTVQEALTHPRSFSRCVRDAISIAHQLSIRWALCPLSSPRRILTIGIAAGEFSNLDIYIQSILNVNLPGNSLIRVTDYARLCVLANDIRATFCSRPKEIEMPNGEALAVWWITRFWSTIYWDFVPVLLNDRLLQTFSRFNRESVKLFWLPEGQEKITDNEKGPNAITTFLRSPQDSFLGLEIAKTLFYRRNFFEANEILRLILSTEPSNLTARTLRISIFWNLGLDDSLPYSVSETYFKRAYEEAAFIEEICMAKDEDYYCEYGLAKLGQALRILRLIKKNRGKYEEDDIKLAKEDVYELLNDSVDIFEKGITISPTGNRSNFFSMCVRSLYRMLKKDEDFFKEPDKRILDTHHICKKTAQEFFLAAGLLRKDYPEDMQHYILEKRLANAVKAYDNSVLLRANRPNLKYVAASMLWDFSPMITVGMAEKVIEWLKAASEMAKRLEEDNICIYSVTRCHGDILPAETFVKHMERAIVEIENRAGRLEDLEGRGGTDPVDPERIDGLKLFCLQI